jgi:pimeloyl-ACP methyl ester carboxylesterase
VPRAKLEARWRVQPAPAGCAATGAPIVFLPALGLTQHSWTATTARLAACRARVLVDLPGTGESSPTGAFDAEAAVAAVADVVDAVAPTGRVVLVGHSLGGAIAARLAERLGARVEALVLMGAPVAPFPLSLWERAVLWKWLWPFFHLAGAWAGVRLGLARVEPGSERLPPLDLALLSDEWSDHRRREAERQYYHAFLDGDPIARSGAALVAVRAPKLCVWGGADRIVPYSAAFAALCPQRIVAGAGHLMPMTMPGEMAAILEAFLASLPASAPAPAEARAIVVRDGARQPGDLVWSSRRELFPLAGVGLLLPLDGRADLSFHLGLARGGIDRRFPVESGRIALLVGAAIRGDASGWQLAYLRATGRLELVWRWTGGFHVDGTLMVDPRNGNVGGYGAVGYSPSVVPWLRAFVGGGALPGEGGRFLVGVDVTARLTGWLW